MKEKMIDILGIIAFYSLIVIGVIIVDARIGQLNEQQKSATEPRTHIAQINR